MATLISRVRTKIGDPGGGSQVFTDQEVQDALDNHRQEVRYEGLAYSGTFSGGNWLYQDYYSEGRDFEDDFALSNGSGTAYTPDSSEPAIGHFHFNAGQNPPVYVTGKTYDVAAACVELLRAWVAKVKLEYGFSTAGDTFNRREKVLNLTDLIAQYEREMRPVVMSAERTDMRGATWDQ